MSPDSNTFPVCTGVLQRAISPTPDKPASFARQIGSIVARQQAVTSNAPLHDRCSSDTATGQDVAEYVGRQLPHLCVALSGGHCVCPRSRTTTQAIIAVHGAGATGLMHTEDTGQLASPFHRSKSDVQ